MADDRSGAARDVVAHGDGGHEEVARADVHVGADRGVVFVHTVVVGGDCATADVGVLAEVGVAHIAQMRHLGATADVRLLHLDECAGFGFLTDLVARPQIGPRADCGSTADVCALHARALHMRLHVHGGVDERRVRADLRFGAD